jgi:hypothetical protein
MNIARAVSHSTARLLIVLSVVAGLVFTGAGSRALGQSQTGFTYNGIVRLVYSNSDLGTSGDETYVQFIHDSGATHVEISIEWFVQSASGTTIAASSTQSATDAQIIASIQQYHNLGIKVFLKPQVDLIDYSVWRGELAPSSVSDWFTSYQAYIVHYAQLAQQYNVEGLSIGTELKSLSGSANLPYWKTLIGAVRAAYSGPIVYGANATGAGDEFTTVSFWSLVDIIGVDGYFGLTDQSDPTVGQLESAWTDSSSTYTGAGFNAVAALKSLANQYDKPLVFAEIGYESTPGTNEQPYNYGLSDGYDPTEQADCYTAFFETFSQETSWMKGVFWVDLQLPVPGAADPGYVMYGKPAGAVMTQWFGGSFTIASSAPTLSISQGGNGTSTISVTDLGGFTGSVALAASGLPSGITATWSTNPATGSSVLTLTASGTAATGASTVTITGASGSLTSSTTIALTVNAATIPGFALSASAYSVTIVQGNSATDTISVVDVGGFTGSVTLAASGLPSGITATWGTNPATGSSVLTLTASSTAATGASTVTITGTSGSLTASTTIALTVNAATIPGFTISASPTSLTAAAGSGGSSAITVTPSGGFTGSVALTAAITAEPTDAVNPPTWSFSTNPVIIPAAISTGGAAIILSTTAPSSGGSCIAAAPTHPGIPWYTGGGAALTCILLFGIPARRRRWRQMFAVLVLLLALNGGIAACGGHGKTVCIPTPITPGTTTGAYTVTVTASSGTITAAPITVALNVQ